MRLLSLPLSGFLSSKDSPLQGIILALNLRPLGVFAVLPKLGHWQWVLRCELNAVTLGVVELPDEFIKYNQVRDNTDYSRNP